MQISTSDCVITLLPIGDEKEETVAWDCYITHKPSGASGDGSAYTEEDAQCMGIESVMSTAKFKEWHHKTYGAEFQSKKKQEKLIHVTVEASDGSRHSIRIPESKKDAPLEAIKDIVIEEVICETKYKRQYTFGNKCKVLSVNGVKVK